MGIKSAIASLYAKRIYTRTHKWSRRPVKVQKKWMADLINAGRKTAFGNDHRLEDVHTYKEFTEAVPLTHYEGLSAYIDRIIDGEADVLWPGRPRYFATTAGTTSGSKFIPLTRESIPYHIKGARDATFLHAYHSGNSSFFDRKMIFLSGSPDLELKGTIPSGRLSGIVNHHIPAYLKGNQLPSKKTNRIQDWEQKIDRIVDETIDQDMGLISGIPPWIQMYFDKLEDRSGKKILELFPNLQLLAHGGVNFEPYKSGLFNSLGGDIEMLETYPASEGFIALQDFTEKQRAVDGLEGLLLYLDAGILFEFVLLEEIGSENPKRIMIDEVELNKNYAVVLNTNAGLWGYIIGDTVEFVSKEPYRIRVTGRVEHFISAFGEHVIVSEVEDALIEAASKFNARIVEFTVAPQISSNGGLPHHEWFVELSKTPANMDDFKTEIDAALCQKNSYYNDLITGGVLQPLKITIVKQGGFRGYMESIGKLGGQNKLPRLSNDRKIAEALKEFVIHDS